MGRAKVWTGDRTVPATAAVPRSVSFDNMRFCMSATVTAACHMIPGSQVRKYSTSRLISHPDPRGTGLAATVTAGSGLEIKGMISLNVQC